MVKSLQICVENDAWQNIMAKIQYPPQGGEKKICLSLCFMALCSVLSGVLMVYFAAIIYIPGSTILQSKIEGKKYFLCASIHKLIIFNNV